MKIETKELSLKDGISKEWIITNGIGGYSASTIFGINTRKYHGLLVAPLTPPARRHLILSKIDEAIEIDGTNYNLYSNMCKNYISEGFKYQTEFEKEYIPIFTYKVKDIVINNEQLETYIKLIKKDKATGKIVSASSATFRIKAMEDIYDRGNNKILYKKGEIIKQKIGSTTYDTFTTNSENLIVPANSYANENDEIGSVTTPLKLEVRQIPNI